MQQLESGNTTALEQAQQELEKMLIEIALEASQGHKQEAAKLLGWGRNTITRKQKKYRDDGSGID
jgi:two-component system nitrogen regulation response regulator GlnG